MDSISIRRVNNGWILTSPENGDHVAVEAADLVARVMEWAAWSADPTPDHSHDIDTADPGAYAGEPATDRQEAAETLPRQQAANGHHVSHAADENSGKEGPPNQSKQPKMTKAGVPRARRRTKAEMEAAMEAAKAAGHQSVLAKRLRRTASA